MPKDATEWSEHYLGLSIHARKLERERNAARIPICIGRPIIEILSKEGMWTSMNGNSVVAADCLFGSNPYQENAENQATTSLASRRRHPKLSPTPCASALIETINLFESLSKKP